jgi:hypothetical protein
VIDYSSNKVRTTALSLYYPPPATLQFDSSTQILNTEYMNVLHIHNPLRSLLFAIIFSIISYFLFLSPTALAQTATDAASIGVGIAQMIEVRDQEAEEGDLVSFDDKGYYLSNKEYDAAIVGVVVNVPAVSLEEKVTENDKYIITSGTALVKVSTQNGDIKKGDLITTSTSKGIGQKATRDGYIIGNALEDHSGDEIGKIPVSLHFGFNTSDVTLRSNLLNNLNLALTSPFQSPVNALRYLLAGLIAIIALGAGLAFFGRVTSRGIEALGRNPLATTAIIISIVINLILALGIMAVGITIAYFVLVL